MTVRKLVWQRKVRAAADSSSSTVPGSFMQYVRPGYFTIVVMISDEESSFSHFCYSCGSLIVRSSLGYVINQAISSHFAGNCTLFQLL